MLGNVWAKSPRESAATGELLTGHLEATLRAAGQVKARVGDLAIVPSGFWEWAALAALFHDAGKIASGFQRMVGNGPGEQETWGQRHEVLSLYAVALLGGLGDDARQWIAAAIASHHRPFTGQNGRSLFAQYSGDDVEAFASRFGPVDEGAAAELLCWLAETGQRHGLLPPEVTIPVTGTAEAAHAAFGELRDTWAGRVPRDRGRIAVLLQGAVTFADHLASSHGRLHTVQPVGAAFAGKLGARMVLHDHQEHAGKVGGHMILRAPTGSGKTEAALLWASAQVEAIRGQTGGEPRVFYTLPYLASINAMTDRLGGVLGGPGLVGVAHSRAGSYHLSRCSHDEDTARAARRATAAAAATRMFRELVRVGTPYSLLRGALAGTGGSSVLIDSANSVFILDELHAYDPKRTGFILAMAKFWEQLGGRVAVTSATLPPPLAVMLHETLAAPVTEVSGMAGARPRHRLAVRAGHLTAAGGEIEARLRAGRLAVLVVANKVADARALFEQLAPLARALHGEDAAHLLHSRFRAMDRDAIEQRILARYGSGKPRRPGLVVATQVVEVSLDVDFDCLYTSGAPLEALAQRFGRVNRLGARPPADVVVHTPEYVTRGRQGYADGVYEAEPVRLSMDILRRQNPSEGSQELGEGDLAQWLGQIYATEWGERWRRQVTRHRDLFERTFLAFRMPFDDRADLEARWDELFDGAEAILAGDRDAYAAALNTVTGAGGRLLGSQYLIPLPAYGRKASRYDRELRVAVITAGYDPHCGLGKIHHP